MGIRTLFTLATLGLATAETSVVSLFLIGADQQKLVGSVVAESSQTTTYSVNCPSGTDTNDCAFLPGLLYTAGPTTVQWAMKSPYDVAGTVRCSLGGTTSVSCTDIVPSTVPSSDIPDKSDQVMTLTGSKIQFMPVTITAGPSTTATDASSTSSDSMAAQTASTGAGVSATEPSSTTSTGGLPQLTANAHIALGAAAAIVAVL